MNYRPSYPSLSLSLSRSLAPLRRYLIFSSTSNEATQKNGERGVRERERERERERREKEKGGEGEDPKKKKKKKKRKKKKKKKKRKKKKKKKKKKKGPGEKVGQQVEKQDSAREASGCLSSTLLFFLLGARETDTKASVMNISFHSQSKRSFTDWPT